MSKILVIDDDHDIVALLKKFLVKHGFEVETAYNGDMGEKLVSSFNPDLVMSDYRLDDMDGAELLAKIKLKNPNIPVIIITGYSDLRTAIRLMRNGAFDYLTKPLIPDEILLIINQALVQAESPSKLPKTKRAYPYLFSPSNHSKNMERQLSLVAPTDYSIIIYGESGAGKEGIARIIHEKSLRAAKPFVAMDCGAISKELAGSELFGHEKGSFTGAVNQREGHFEQANGGTLFLDEVANLPYEVQTSLLRVLQEKTLRRVGGTKEMAVDVRIIVASNEKLTVAIQQGKFREDLYHRLNEFNIDVLPLRNRKEDIMFFANYFLHEACGDLHKNLTGFEKEVEEVFENYTWPGNIRELKNVIKRAALLSDQTKVDIKSLPFEILNYSRISFDNDEQGNAETNVAVFPTSSDSANGNNGQNGFSKPKLKNAALEAEHKMIMDALTKTDFNKSKAAGILGIDRKTLYNKMKLMKILHK